MKTASRMLHKKPGQLLFLNITDVNFSCTNRLLCQFLRDGEKGFERWQGREKDLLAVGQRAIEVARLAAVEAAQTSAVETDKADWETTSDLASKAVEALEEVINHLASPSALYLKGRDSAPASVPITKLLEKPLGFMLPRLRKSHRARHTGKAEAETLCAALDILKGVHTVSRDIRRDHFASRQNPGTPEKNAFVREMMAAWIFLTGSKPSPKNATFADYLSEGWQDICPDGEPENWENAIKAAGKEIDIYEVRTIIADGPDWL